MPQRAVLKSTLGVYLPERDGGCEVGGELEVGRSTNVSEGGAYLKRRWKSSLYLAHFSMPPTLEQKGSRGH